MKIVTMLIVVGVLAQTAATAQWQRHVGPGGEQYRRVTCMEFDGRRLLCGTFERGVWSLDPTTLQWTSASDTVLTDRQQIYALHRTRDGMFAAANEEMFLQRTGASAWSVMESWPRNATATNIVTIGRTVVAAGPKMGVWRLDAINGSWRRATTDTAFARVHAMANIDSALLIATPNGLFLSNDIGDRWRRLEVADGYVAARYVVSIGDSALLTVVDVDTTMVLRSTDRGRTWQEVHDPVPGMFTTESGVTERGTAFLATSNGVYRSMSHGAHWEAVNAGLEQVLLDATVLTVCSARGRLFAALSNGDVWWRDGSEVTVSVPVEIPYKAYQVSRTMHAIVVRIEQPGRDPRADVFDLRGRLLRSVHLRQGVNVIDADLTDMVVIR